MSGRLTYYFSAKRDRDRLFQQADELTDALMELEDEDEGVTDGTVAVDADMGLVTVEVYSHGDDPRATEAAALKRIFDALSLAGIPADPAPERQPRHVMEYA